MEKRYLTWKEAKAYTGMSDDTLEYILRCEKVYVYQEQFGSRRFVDKQDIDRAFNRRKKTHNTSVNYKKFYKC